MIGVCRSAVDQQVRKTTSVAIINPQKVVRVNRRVAFVICIQVELPVNHYVSLCPACDVVSQFCNGLWQDGAKEGRNWTIRGKLREVLRVEVLRPDADVILVSSHQTICDGELEFSCIHNVYDSLIIVDDSDDQDVVVFDLAATVVERLSPCEVNQKVAL